MKISSTGVPWWGLSCTSICTSRSERCQNETDLYHIVYSVRVHLLLVLRNQPHQFLLAIAWTTRLVVLPRLTLAVLSIRCQIIRASPTNHPDDTVRGRSELKEYACCCSRGCRQERRGCAAAGQAAVTVAGGRWPSRLPELGLSERESTVSELVDWTPFELADPRTIQNFRSSPILVR